MTVPACSILFLSTVTIVTSALLVKADLPKPINKKTDAVNFRVSDQIRVDGSIYCGKSLFAADVYSRSFNKISSRESKKDIKPVGVDTAYSVLESLDTVRYRYKDEDDSTKYSFGFIAEEVDHRISGKQAKTISTDNIVAFLTSVIRDQDRRIRDQDQRIKALETRLDPSK